ncbi:hypothetical protein JAAARDRAFT_208366 [Jaapia argillacea MUCL 33604]|uniref:F-box domain-containing protein n=1 Tax=Jaapia argillacea MUCL 33604 TaxID=933084 RepID=A0A067PY37_9AGAM|nr:hypothetical protein JAAARDRAFT_208366 [Jaapia argillacea MUCL 33604]
MTRVLEIDEIYRKICEDLRSSQEYGWRQDLVRLARSSRMLSGEAMNVLWDQLDDPKPLLNLFPAGLLAQKATQRRDVELINYTAVTYIPSRIPEKDDWLRFDFYARRVRSLCVSATSTDGRIFHLLSQYKTGPLLPSLRTLRWWDGSPRSYLSFIDDFSSLITPSLLNLFIGFSSLSLRHPDELDLLITFLDKLPRLCPRVTIFAFEKLPSSLSFLSGFQDLQTLELDSERQITTLELRVMALLPRLKALTGLKIAGTDLNVTSLELGFPSLTRLGIAGEAYLSIGGGGKLITSKEYLACVDAISCKGESLVELSLCCGFGSVVPDEPPGLDITQGFDGIPRKALTSEDAKIMGLAWPKLKTLHLHSPVAFSLESLAVFADHNPTLEALTTNLLVDNISHGVIDNLPILSHKLAILSSYSAYQDVDDLLLARAIDQLFPMLNLDECSLISAKLLSTLSLLQRVRKGHEKRLGLRSVKAGSL